MWGEQGKRCAGSVGDDPATQHHYFMGVGVFIAFGVTFVGRRLVIMSMAAVVMVRVGDLNGARLGVGEMGAEREKSHQVKAHHEKRNERSHVSISN